MLRTEERPTDHNLRSTMSPFFISIEITIDYLRYEAALLTLMATDRHAAQRNNRRMMINGRLLHTENGQWRPAQSMEASAVDGGTSADDGVDGSNEGNLVVMDQTRKGKSAPSHGAATVETPTED